MQIGDLLFYSSERFKFYKQKVLLATIIRVIDNGERFVLYNIGSGDTYLYRLEELNYCWTKVTGQETMAVLFEMNRSKNWSIAHE